MLDCLILQADDSNEQSDAIHLAAICTDANSYKLPACRGGPRIKVRCGGRRTFKEGGKRVAIDEGKHPVLPEPSNLDLE